MDWVDVLELLDYWHRHPPTHIAAGMLVGNGRVIAPKTPKMSKGDEIAASVPKMPMSEVPEYARAFLRDSLKQGKPPVN